MNESTLQIFRTLEGRWKIARELDNKGNAYGIATFTMRDNLIDYKEELQVKFQGRLALTEAHQEYTFVYNQDNNTIEQLTSSGELMYGLQIELRRAMGKYLCGSDTYVANYHFVDDNKFTLKYLVRGPQKDYIISTEFEKLSF